MGKPAGYDNLAAAVGNLRLAVNHAKGYSASADARVLEARMQAVERALASLASDAPTETRPPGFLTR